MRQISRSVVILFANIRFQVRFFTLYKESLPFESKVK